MEQREDDRKKTRECTVPSHSAAKIKCGARVMGGVLARLVSLSTPFVLRVIHGSLAQGFNQAVTILVQLVSVPVLLRFWGVEGYGAWITLSAIPAYLAMADFGFSQVAAFEMTMDVGAGNRASAVTKFQSVIVLVGILGLLILAGAALLIFALPFTDIFKLGAISLETARAVILVLSMQVVVTIFFGVISGGMRATGQLALAVYLTATSRLLEQGAVLLVASFGAGMVEASGMMLLARVGVTVVAVLTMLRFAPWMSIGFSRASLKTIRRLFAPSVIYMSYTLGGLINIQGVTLVVAALFGPVAVASFSAMRTLARLGPAFANILSYSLEPEYSFIYGSGNLDRYRRLLKRHIFVTVLVCISYVVGMLSLSHWVLHIWTGERVIPIEPLFTLIIFSSAAEIIWSSGQSPLVSVTKHKIAASSYLFLSVVSIAAMNMAAKKYGINAIGIISVGVSLLMVVITKVRIWQEFFSSP